MKKVFSALLLCVMMFAGSSLLAQGTQWYIDFDEAVAVAKKSNKILFVDFTGSDWCGWCIRLKKEVLDKKEFLDYAAKNLILVEVDFPQNKWQTPKMKQANQALAAKYGVQGYPTIVLMKPDGSVIAKTGYRRGGAAAYVTYLQKLLKKNSK